MCAWCSEPARQFVPDVATNPETVAPAPAGSTPSRLFARRRPPGEVRRRPCHGHPLPRCAGIDVHKDNVVVCLRRCDRPGKVVEQVRTFATATADLLALADWLAGGGVTHAALESTGVYWKPVFNVLEGGCQVILVNAEHIKQVPGRKTDVKDCAWIAQLL